MPQERTKSPQDAAWMRLDARAALEKRRQFFSRKHPAGLLDHIEKKGDRFFVEFVRTFRSAFAREKSGQAFALEQCLGDVKRGSGYAKGVGGVDNRAPFFLDAAQHLVLDLDHIVRVEEGAVVKKSVGHVARARMGGAVVAESFLTAGALTRICGHVCLYYYVLYE